MCIHAAAYIFLSGVPSIQFGFTNSFQKVWVKAGKNKMEKDFSSPSLSRAWPNPFLPRGLPISPFPPFSFTQPSPAPARPTSWPDGQPALHAPPLRRCGWQGGPALPRHCQAGPGSQTRLPPRVRPGHKSELNLSRAFRANSPDSARFRPIPALYIPPRNRLTHPEPQSPRQISPKPSPRSATQPIRRCSASRASWADCRASESPCEVAGTLFSRFRAPCSMLTIAELLSRFAVRRSSPQAVAGHSLLRFLPQVSSRQASKRPGVLGLYSTAF